MEAQQHEGTDSSAYSAFDIDESNCGDDLDSIRFPNSYVDDADTNYDNYEAFAYENSEVPYFESESKEGRCLLLLL